MIRAEISGEKKTGKVRFIAQIAKLFYRIPFQTNLTLLNLPFFS